MRHPQNQVSAVKDIEENFTRYTVPELAEKHDLAKSTVSNIITKYLRNKSRITESTLIRIRSDFRYGIMIHDVINKYEILYEDALRIKMSLNVAGRRFIIPNEPRNYWNSEDEMQIQYYRADDLVGDEKIILESL